MLQEPKLKFFQTPEGQAPKDLSQKGRKIAYYEWENPASTKNLICVHGLTRNSRDFDYIATALSKHYRVIAIDVAGRGKSDWLEDKTHYNVPVYATDIIALLKELKIENADWIGTSMGGLIGMLIASTQTFQKQPIQKLILNDIGPFISADGLQNISQYVGNSPAFANLLEAEEYFKAIYDSWNITDEQIRHLVKHSVVKTQTGTLITHYDPGIAAAFVGESSVVAKENGIDLWEMWNNITAPTLVVRGEKSDILGKDTAAKMTSSRDNVKLVEIPNTGHAPSLMSNDQIQIIQDWLLS